MSRRGKLAVALLLALLLHALLLWSPRPEQVPEAAEAPLMPARDAIAVGWDRAGAPSTLRPASPAAAAAGQAAAMRARSALPPDTGPAGPAPRDYSERVRRHLSRFAGDLSGIEAGEARVRFTVGTDGQVSDIELLRSSGDPQLDEAALALPEQSAPLPPPGRDAVRLEVPVRAGPQAR